MFSKYLFIRINQLYFLFIIPINYLRTLRIHLEQVLGIVFNLIKKFIKNRFIKIYNNSNLIRSLLLTISGFNSYELKLPTPIYYLWQTKKIQTSRNINNNLDVYFNFEEEIDYEPPTFKESIFITFNVLYFIVIFGFLVIEPIYLFIQLVTNNNFTRQYVAYLCLFLLTPVNYLWSKYYLNTDHLKTILKQSYIECGLKYRHLVIVSTILSVLYLIIISTILRKDGDEQVDIFVNSDNINNFHFPYYTYEFISKILMFHNYIIAIVVFYEHNSLMKNFINKINKGHCFELNNLKTIKSLTKELNNIKSKLQCSIHYFNTLISVTTVLVCLSIFLFFEAKFRFEQDLINPIYSGTLIIFYSINQCVFFCILWYYGDKRNKLFSTISSQAFASKFVLVNNLQMQDSNKSILAYLHWITLKELLEKNWCQFKILGISELDGDLIKKAIAIGSLLIIIFSI